MDPATRTKLFNQIVGLCGQQGRLTDHSFDLVDNLLDSIDVESETAAEP
jgi:hypothetical protein